MGLGQALVEELVMEGGQVTNAYLRDYKLPITAEEIYHALKRNNR